MSKAFNDSDVMGVVDGVWLGLQAECAILVMRDMHDQLHISCSDDESASVELLDQAMEYIDGQRLPPDAE